MQTATLAHGHDPMGLSYTLGMTASIVGLLTGLDAIAQHGAYLITVLGPLACAVAALWGARIAQLRVKLDRERFEWERALRSHRTRPETDDD